MLSTERVDEKSPIEIQFLFLITRNRFSYLSRLSLYSYIVSILILAPSETTVFNTRDQTASILVVAKYHTIYMLDAQIDIQRNIHTKVLFNPRIHLTHTIRPADTTERNLRSHGTPNKFRVHKRAVLCALTNEYSCANNKMRRGTLVYARTMLVIQFLVPSGFRVRMVMEVEDIRTVCAATKNNNDITIKADGNNMVVMCFVINEQTSEQTRGLV